jgi:activating signal cointegrator complex subunit 1
MSIASPQIVKIGNRRYRKNPVNIFYQNESFTRPYEEETDEMFTKENECYSNKDKDVYEDESCLLDCKIDRPLKSEKSSNEGEDYEGILLSENGKLIYKMQIAEAYLGYIIGKGGSVKSRLEIDTKTRVKIPKRGVDDLVTIEGKEKSNIISCKNRILLLISTARFQKPFTHLLTFPMNFEPFKSKLSEFKQTVLQSCSNDRGIDETIFQNPNKLHLTICTVVLADKHEVEQAIALLDSYQNTLAKEITNTNGVRVQIRGLEYMNDDPSEVDVLYAKIVDTETSNACPSRIQSIANKLMEKFVDSGLSKRQYDKVKLHATVMNSLMRQDSSGMSSARMTSNNKFVDRDRESFDARNILKLFGDFDFGIYTLNEIHLSLRFSASNQDGYYECIAKINLRG